MNEMKCVVVSCHRPATMRLTMGIRVEYYCDYHTGECGGLFIDAAWPFLQQETSKPWEQEQERQRHESEDT